MTLGLEFVKSEMVLSFRTQKMSLGQALSALMNTVLVPDSRLHGECEAFLAKVKSE
jgi:hypothetical protein